MSKVLDFTILIATCTLVVTVSSFCFNGIDLTDESFYLIWISKPYLYKWTATLFGFIYHPLYKILGESIALLRIFNTFITFLLSLVLTKTVLIRITPETFVNKNIWPKVIGLASAGLLSIIINSYWLPTPSYNTLCLQALLITTIALSRITYSPQQPLLNWIILSFGAVLVFCAKPTSAFLLAFLVLSYLLSTVQPQKKQLFLTFILTIIILTIIALLYDNSVHQFYIRLSRGAYLSKVLSHNTLLKSFRIDHLIMGSQTKKTFFLLTLTNIFFFIALNLKNKWLHLSLQLIQLSLLIASLLFIFFYPSIPITSSADKNLLIASIPLSLIIYGLGYSLFHLKFSFNKKLFTFFIYLLALPYVYVFGTGNNYWHAMGPSSIFWVLGGIVFLKACKPKRVDTILEHISITTFILTTLFICLGFNTPYRQPSLSQHTEPVQIMANKETLKFSKDYALFLNSLIKVSRSYGFTNDTPMIDLTGHSPGVLFILGAKSLGQPWLLGGYPGSQKLALASLQTETCDDISQSWLLIEINGKTVIDESILNEFGLDIKEDYKPLIKLTNPYKKRNCSDECQYVLLKPRQENKKASQNCVKNKI